ncbi:MAG TPA: M1 family metallopeptidase [Candidatus Tectomicrobia bacterium]|nr:M1 family metallopeptidase [Candidatus Tectomicrobia bacterium]
MASVATSLLPAEVRPVRYRITLSPNLTDFTFVGEETIDIEVKQPTSRIVLNAAELEVQQAYLLRDGQRISAQAVGLDADTETATLTFATPLPTGTAQLGLRFTGILNDKLRGFYRSEYSLPDGTKRVMATTQFEAPDARRAFPCWDEPAHKAKFEISLSIPTHLTAISNMPIVSETPQGAGTKLVHFAESPIMSTYLLAIMVGEFECVEAQVEGTLVRVWTTPGKKEQGRYALDVSCRLLSFYNNYFGILYPLPKLDLIAIPDFAAGAMENWGAITYREVALLVDPAHSSAATKQRVAIIIAHEIAHMWFGNLVTMEWWNDLWLNEGFASWIEYKSVDHLFPEWDMWTQFIFADTGPAMSLDGLRNTHPIEAEVKTPHDINELFDAISYSKGAAIIRMLEQFLGEETFRRGLVHYLSAHAYGNARTEDLWASLAHVSGKPVKDIMDTWTKQPGYPVVEVRHQDRGHEPAALELAQRRFLYDYDPAHDEPGPSLWRIPVSIKSDTARSAAAVTPFFAMLEERQANVLLPEGMSSGGAQPWIIVNAGRTGFFRVNYSAEMWDRSRLAIETQALPTAERLGLGADAFALMRAGYLPATQFLSLASAYTQEREYPVWSDLVGSLGWVSSVLAGVPFEAQLKGFARDLLRPIVVHLGWEARPDESHLEALLRGIVLHEIGHYDEAPVIAEARARFERYMGDPQSVHPDLRSTVLNLAAHGGDRQTYEALREAERRATLQEEKLRALGALAHFRQPDLLRDALDLSLSPVVRSQDTIRVVAGVAANPHGRDLAWEFVQANWAEFDRRYGGGGFLLMRLIESVTSAFTTAEREREVAAFFKEHPAPSAARTIQQCLERIRINTRWLGRNREALATWFKAV